MTIVTNPNRRGFLTSAFAAGLLTRGHSPNPGPATPDLDDLSRRYQSAIAARIQLFRDLDDAEPYPQLPGENGRQAERRVWDRLRYDEINGEFYNADRALRAAMKSPGARPGSARACVAGGFLYIVGEELDFHGNEADNDGLVQYMRVVDVVGLAIGTKGGAR